MAAMIKTAAVFSAAVCLVCPPILDAQVSSRDWPQWRGPTRDGSIPTFTVPATWPERLTLKKCWPRSMPRTASRPGDRATPQRIQVSNTSTWSQPAIVSNRLFVKDVETLAL